MITIKGNSVRITATKNDNTFILPDGYSYEVIPSDQFK